MRLGIAVATDLDAADLPAIMSCLDEALATYPTADLYLRVAYDGQHPATPGERLVALYLRSRERRYRLATLAPGCPFGYAARDAALGASIDRAYLFIATTPGFEAFLVYLHHELQQRQIPYETWQVHEAARTLYAGQLVATPTTPAAKERLPVGDV